MQQQAFEKSKAAFYADIDGDCHQPKVARQDMGSAADIFWGNETRELGQQNGEPTTGYSGFKPRQDADGIFGVTSGASSVAAHQSMNRIKNEKADTLRTTQRFMPSY